MLLSHLLLGVLPAASTAVSLGQRPLISMVDEDGNSQMDLAAKASVLKTHAEQLYKIAELSIDEYNHPTRVIGSKGQ